MIWNHVKGYWDRSKAHFDLGIYETASKRDDVEQTYLFGGGPAGASRRESIMLSSLWGSSSFIVLGTIGSWLIVFFAGISLFSTLPSPVLALHVPTEPGWERVVSSLLWLAVALGVIFILISLLFIFRDSIPRVFETLSVSPRYRGGSPSSAPSAPLVKKLAVEFCFYLVLALGIFIRQNMDVVNMAWTMDNLNWGAFTVSLVIGLVVFPRAMRRIKRDRPDSILELIAWPFGFGFLVDLSRLALVTGVSAIPRF